MTGRENCIVITKDFFVILQCGFYFRCDGKVLIFMRPNQEKDGTEKITSKASAIVSFSPEGIAPGSLKKTMLHKKIDLAAGSSIKLDPAGIAFSDMSTEEFPLRPSFLFLLYEISIQEEDILRIRPKAKGGDSRKEMEGKCGWFNIDEFHEYGFPGTHTNVLNGKNEQIYV